MAPHIRVTTKDTMGSGDDCKSAAVPLRRYLFVLGFAAVFLMNTKVTQRALVARDSYGSDQLLLDLKETMVNIQKQSSATAALLSAELRARNDTRSDRQQQNTPLSISQLAGTAAASDTTCPHGLQAIQDIVLPESVTTEHRKIPPIVHMTGKSRCVHKDVYENQKKWRLEGYSFFYHDDAAVKRLLSQRLPEFPHLKDFAACLPSGAALADLWRYVLLWEYGGIYTDLDQAPGTRFNADAITADDDAFLVPELGGHLAQYFIAVSPRHPLMYFTIQAALFGLYRVDDVDAQYVPRTTGPEALRAGFKQFMGTNTANKTFHEPTAGHYVGRFLDEAGNKRSVTVVGSKRTTKDWIDRYSIRDKNEKYKDMGMMHFSEARKPSNDTCWQRLYTTRFKQQ